MRYETVIKIDNVAKKVFFALWIIALILGLLAIVGGLVNNDGMLTLGIIGALMCGGAAIVVAGGMLVLLLTW